MFRRLDLTAFFRVFSEPYTTVSYVAIRHKPGTKYNIF